MSFRAWSGAGPEVLVAICEMKQCQVCNLDPSSASFITIHPLDCPLIGKQWGINFADRLLHNGANINLFLCIFRLETSLPNRRRVFWSNIAFLRPACAFIYHSPSGGGSPKPGGAENVWGEVRLCRKQFSAFPLIRSPAIVAKPGTRPVGSTLFPSLFWATSNFLGIRRPISSESGIIWAQNPRNLDPSSKARGPWCKNLFPEPQGFRAAQRGFTVGSRIHSMPKRATLSARNFQNHTWWWHRGGNMILLLWSVTISLTVTTSECGIKSDFWSARNGRLSIRIYLRLNLLKDISSQMGGLC